MNSTIVRPSGLGGIPRMRYKRRGSWRTCAEPLPGTGLDLVFDFATWNLKSYVDQEFYGVGMEFDIQSWGLGSFDFGPGRPAGSAASFGLEVYLVYEAFDQTTVDWASRPTDLEKVADVTWGETVVQVMTEYEYAPGLYAPVYFTQGSRVFSSIWLPLHDLTSREVFGLLARRKFSPDDGTWGVYVTTGYIFIVGTDFKVPVPPE